MNDVYYYKGIEDVTQTSCLLAANLSDTKQQLIQLINFWFASSMDSLS